MAAHARLSPSGAAGWMNCSQWASSSTGSTYARRGTAAHQLAARVLTGNTNAADHLGELIEVADSDVTEVFTVDQDMVDTVGTYVHVVRDYATNHTMHVEQAVPIDQITDEPNATGTADAVLISHDGDEIVVIDLKTGRGVEVEVENNAQAQMYAHGTLQLARMAGLNPTTVRLVISQPPVSRAPSEWVCNVQMLDAFAARARTAALKHGTEPATPGESQCRWCAKKATCSALAVEVQDTIGAQFEDLTATKAEGDAVVSGLVKQADVAGALAAVDLIEDWCKAIRVEAERRLHAGEQVHGYKLVAGRKGARAWTDAAAAEELLRKSFRLTIEQAFDLKLISPASAEKVLKEKPKQWAKAQELISQAEGRPTVAPLSDKRPALQILQGADQFRDESGHDLT